ncbi:ERBB receptor feedback inhibitor 1 [Lampris incognitus]|uniref:ERBB receptor feedback inhibitor 1 n=1 Tax=Lampris incognitus TaxID=2546036 RepID=UPI0024B58B5C|nr:ERBB receptor feedback inhibitor 1 [Lampris incognitus]
MAGSRPTYWGKRDLNSLSFGLAADMEHSLTAPRQQKVSKEFKRKFSLSQLPFDSDIYHSTLHHDTPQLQEGDQVVPSFKRLTMLEGCHRESKPLPPLPDPAELMLDEAADSEVEFFTNDRRRLLPKSCPKAVHYGSSSRGTYRGYGQVNYAYQEKALDGGTAGSGIAHSWPNTEDSIAAVGWMSRGTNTGSGFDTEGWAIDGVKYATQGQQLKRKDDERTLMAVEDTSYRKKPDQLVSPWLRYSYSGPADHHPHSNLTPCPTEKPEIPPRRPIPPKPSSLTKTVTNEWSISDNDEDKPPKIPPRVPLVPACPPRTPSPKSLPLYINGVMPVTQSFAPNPKYVSKAVQEQQSEKAPPPGQCSPCIVPVMKDGRQASATHYFLLPCRREHNRQQQQQNKHNNRTNTTERKNDNSGGRPGWRCQN